MLLPPRHKKPGTVGASPLPLPLLPAHQLDKSQQQRYIRMQEAAMKLWRLTDYYGRTRYYENEKSVKTQMKKVLWYYEENKQAHANSPWFKPPHCEQVVSDQWISANLLTPDEIDVYFDKRRMKEESHRLIREEYQARLAADRRALTGNK